MKWSLHFAGPERAARSIVLATCIAVAPLIPPPLLVYFGLNRMTVILSCAYYCIWLIAAYQPTFRRSEEPPTGTGGV